LSLKVRNYVHYVLQKLSLKVRSPKVRHQGSVTKSHTPRLGLKVRSSRLGLKVRSPKVQNYVLQKFRTTFSKSWVSKFGHQKFRTTFSKSSELRSPKVESQSSELRSLRSPKVESQSSVIFRTRQDGSARCLVMRVDCGSISDCACVCVCVYV